MSEKTKVIGATVGTPLSLSKIKEKFSPYIRQQGYEEETGYIYNLEIGKEYKLVCEPLVGDPSDFEKAYISCYIPEEGEVIGFSFSSSQTDTLTLKILGIEGTIISYECNGEMKTYDVSYNFADTKPSYTLGGCTLREWDGEFFVRNPDGITGGADGKDGKDGVGISEIRCTSATSGAYRIEFTDGSYFDFIVPKGKDGADGKNGIDGKTPYIQDGYWYIDGVNTNVKAEGKDGKDGAKGADGTSVTVLSVSESTVDGGSNVVTFSDGKTLTVKNGSKGKDGADGKGDADVPNYITSEAERVAKAVQATRTAKTFVMACGADMHLKYGDDTDNHPISLVSAQYAGMGVKELKKRIGIDCVALLGDYSWMNAKDYSAEQTMKDIILAKETIGLDGTTKEIYSVGNHDWCYGEGVDRLLTEDEIYAHIGANSDGVKPFSDIERCYGYIDFDNYKIRVINLNTCDCKDGKDNGTDYQVSTNYPRLEFISPTQMRWLADEALDFTQKGEGWGVVFVSHHPLDYGNPWFTHLLQMLEAYRNGSNITLNLYKYHNGTSWIMQKETFDFTAVTNKVEIICGIHGHSHNCGSAKVSSSTCTANATSGVSPWLWRFCIPNMCVGRENEKWNTIHGEVDASGNAVYHRKETGTAKATAFNVVSIDRKYQKIYAHIFGAGKDRAFYYGKEVITSYPITTTLNNCTGASGNATSIDVEGSVTLTFTANDGYALSAVSVSGASHTWDATTGKLVLSNPTANVTVTVTAIEASPSNLLDMSVRTLDTSYTDNYIEATAPHVMDFTKAYPTDSSSKRGAYPTTKFSEFTVLADNGFSANCNSASGYRLEFPVDVESGKTYKLTVANEGAYYIKLLKYNTDTTFNGATDLITTIGAQSATFKAESGYKYSISFPFGSGTRTYTDISLVEAD